MRAGRRVLLAGLAAAILVAGLSPGPRDAAAEPLHRQPHPYRIYMILWRGWEEAAQGFKDYFVNQGIPVELIVRDAAQDKDRLPDFVDEAKTLGVDLVFTWGTTVSEEVLGTIGKVDPARHITDIPAIFAIVSQPLGTMVADYRSSGRNTTGTIYLVPMETQVNLIRSYRPFTRFGVVYNPLERNAQAAIAELTAIGAKSGFTVTAKPLELADGKPVAASIPDRVAALKAEGVDLLYIGPDTFLNVNRDVLTGAALEQGIPSFAAGENPVLTSKAMFGGVYRYYTVGQLSAYKAEQILVGKVKPADIPIDAPKRVDIILNMPVIRQLGLYPPMKLLGLAEVIDPPQGGKAK